MWGVEKNIQYLHAIKINNIYMLRKSGSHAPNIHLSKFIPVCKIILFANQHVSKFKVRSHGFYHQECFCVEINNFWLKTCSIKFSIFAKQENLHLGRPRSLLTPG